MNSLSISQCASLYAVDEFFIQFVINKLDIDAIDIPFESLGIIFEEVLFYKEQFSFLGEFQKPEMNDKCIVFYLSYDINSKRGNAWKVTEFALKSIRIPKENQGKIHIEEDRIWLTKKRKWKIDTAYKEYVYVEYGHEDWGGDTKYCIVIPFSAILNTPPSFKPVLRKNDLFYLDYGKPSGTEIIESHEFYDLVKHYLLGYCIVDKHGYQLTHYYKWVSCNKDGSIWASYEHQNWAGKDYVYYNERGSIRSSAKYESNNGFSEGLCCVEKYSNSWGAINSEGEVIIDYQYRSMKPFNGGISEVTQNVLDESGYINKEGKAVTKSGKLLISKAGETYSFAWVDKGKYRTNTLHMFTIDGEDLCYRLNGSADDRIFFGVTDDGHIGYLNYNYDIIIPLFYKEASRFYNGIARVVTDDGQVIFLNSLNQVLNITQDDFEKNKRVQEEIANRRAEALRRRVDNLFPNTSPYRYYTVHYTEWNGMKKVYRTRAKTKEEAIDNFWDSGVQFGANIDFVD